MSKEKSLCPCGSGKIYSDCCKPYHEGKLPEDALALMKSRYSAYALCLPEYIIQTTHPAHPDFQKDKNKWKRDILFFSQNTQFENLIVHDFTPGNEVAYVTFTAQLSQKGQNTSFTEKSRFEKVGYRWLYLKGEITPVN